jgi:tetratricopeptide (TPR) repeat protein
LLCARQFEASLKAHDEALRIDPTLPFALRGRWWLDYHRGDSSAAIADAADFYEIQGLHPAADVLRRDYPRSTYRETMRSAARALETFADSNFVPSMRIARLYVHAGEYERVLDLLERSLEERFPSVVALNVDPHWDEVRSEPRFQALVEKLRLPVHPLDDPL